MKASMGATRARLVIDPERGPWVTRMFGWRVDEGLSVPGIARRLTQLGAPSPDGNAWSPATVRNILANPKYTGRVVLGRTTNTGPTRRKGERKIRRLPREYWTWAGDANTHPALTDMDTWEAAQQVGRQRGNVRDPLSPARPGARLYPFRARIRCKQCGRRMHGSFSHSRKPGETYTYYVCPTRAANPRHAQDHPAHAWVGIREDVFTAALSGFLDQYAFGYDRAAQLAELIPATQAEQDQADAARAETLTRQLKQADAALEGITAEIGQLAGKTDPVSVAIRDRLTGQFSDRYDQKQAIEAELQAIEDAPPLPGNDLSLIDELPHALGLLAEAPRALQELIASTFDIQCVYRPELKQATVVVTDTTPGIIDAIADPRTDDGSAATSGVAFVDIAHAARTTVHSNIYS
jgi:site-specific DNA recombinase